MIRTHRMLASFTLAAAVLTAPAALGAPQDAPPTSQPAAKEKKHDADALKLVDRMLEAMGGKKKMKDAANRHVKASINMPQMAITLESWRKGENKYLATMDMGMMKVQMGFNGEDAWEDQGQGARRIPIDRAKAQTGQFPDPLMFTKVTDEFMTLEVGEATELDGEKCTKLRLADPKEPTPGQPQGDNFLILSDKTGLAVGIESPNMTGGTDVIRLRDYKKYGDFTLFSKLVMQQMGQPVEMNFEIIDFSVIEDVKFTVPEGVS